MSIQIAPFSHLSETRDDREMEREKVEKKKKVLTLPVNSLSTIDQSGSFILSTLAVIKKALKMLAE